MHLYQLEAKRTKTAERPSGNKLMRNLYNANNSNLYSNNNTQEFFQKIDS